MRGRTRREQPWLIRLTHWVNVPLLAIMAGSGLQIFAAYPQLGPRGEPYGFSPFATAPPGWLRLGEWLAGGRAWHFAFAWFVTLNAFAYLAHLALSGEWRRRLFLPRRDARHAVATLLHYLRLRPAPAPIGLYNGLQRLAYTSSLLFAALAVVTGLAMYKPVQLSPLAAALGGYDVARTLHLGALVLLALFTVVHVVLVALHPRALASMVTGGRREEDPS